MEYKGYAIEINRDNDPSYVISKNDKEVTSCWGDFTPCMALWDALDQIDRVILANHSSMNW